MPEVDQSQAGAIWVKETKDQKIVLNIGIDGEMYVGFQNTKKGDNAKAPDYNICKKLDDGKLENVGAAWKGTTKQQRTKLEIKMTLPGQEPTYFTAVARDGELKEKQADMSILRHADKEEQLSMDSKDVAEPEVKKSAKTV